MYQSVVKKRLGDSNIVIPSANKITAEGLMSHLESEINKLGPIIRKSNIPD